MVQHRRESRKAGAGKVPAIGPFNAHPDPWSRLTPLGNHWASPACPICFNARGLENGALIAEADMGGRVPLWQWIGDDRAVTFSY